MIKAIILFACLAIASAAVIPEEAQEELAPRCLEPTGQFAHSKRCDLFWNCYEGRAFRSKCPEGQLFDSTRGLCWWARDVSCGKRSKPIGELNL
jgi:hypothetical protein